MKRNLKIKILGEKPSELLLALLLLKSGYKVEIVRDSNIQKNNIDEKLIFISHSTKLTLDNINLWCHLQSKAYLIDSLYISDMSISKKLEFSFLDFKFNSVNANNIGWIINYSDISETIMNELSKFNNLFREINLKKNFRLINSYRNNKFTLNEFINKRIFIPIFFKNNNSLIEFTVSLRGYVDNKIYSILSENGFIFLYPINKNLFKVKWIIKNSNLEDRISSSGNSLLLDNLSTIIPRELKIDKIYGDLNVITYCNNINKELSNSNYLSFRRKRSSCNLYLELEDQNLSFDEVISVYNQIKKSNINFLFYAFFNFRFTIVRNLELILASIFYESFISNNYFIKFIKKVVFYLLKRINMFKNFFLKFFIFNF